MTRRKLLGWAGSAGLHLALGGALLLGMGSPPPETVPVMLLEMPAPEPALPVSLPPAPEQLAAAPPESQPPVADPPPPEPMPQLAEAPPEPRVVEPLPPEPPPPEPPPIAEVPPPEPLEEVAELPLPTPPPPPPKAPAPPVRQAAPPRPATPPVQPAVAAMAAPSSAVPAPAPVAAAPSSSYVALLLSALERHKAYPQDARWRRAQGVAILPFRMRRDGTVTSFRLERSAGDAVLDEAVLVMIQRASPLPAPPAEMPGETIELTVPVRFALR
jgi:periplasmic protein TonB